MYVSMADIYSSISATSPPMVDQHSCLWILIVAFILAFFLAFGIGANDVANSFGTSVGSKVLTQRQACILATIFEISGATLLGYKVSSTIRTGMIYVEMYHDTKLLMLGYLSALFGSALWNLVATLFGLPVSGTHSIVGSMIGFSIVAQGFDSVKWPGLGKIVLSWFASPILSGIVSLSLYLFIRKYIINQTDPLKNGLRLLPLFYGFTIFINIFSIVQGGPLFLQYITWWIALIIAIIVGTTVGLLVRIWIVPHLREKILEIKNNLTQSAIQLKNQHMDHYHHHHHHQTNKNINLQHSISAPNKDDPVSILSVTNLSTGEFVADGSNAVTNASDSPSVDCVSNNMNIINANNNINNNDDGSTNQMKDVEKQEKEIDVDDDKPEVAKIFTFLHILTACFSSFAHGSNDTSNAIGPLVAVVMLYRDGVQSDNTPPYLLFFGGVGMSVGLWIWGRRVIQTMGTRLTKITPSTGFTAEIGAATTVLLASKVGIPVSTTHCQVGSVVFVGKAMKTQKGVNWKLFVNIALSWGLTVPASALFSALAMWVLKFTL